MYDLLFKDIETYFRYDFIQLISVRDSWMSKRKLFLGILSAK